MARPEQRQQRSQDGLVWPPPPAGAEFLRRQGEWVDMLLRWRIDYYLRGLPGDASKPCVDQLLEEDRTCKAHAQCLLR